MLRKANKDNWIKPLFAHAVVHSIGTFIVVSFLNIKLAFVLAFLDLILHFVVDRIKASPNIGNKWGIDKPYFWWALGFGLVCSYGGTVGARFDGRVCDDVCPCDGGWCVCTSFSF